MLKKSLFLSLIILAFASVSFTQEAYTPDKDSAVRKAILNALRAPVEKELKQKIVFSVENFKVQGNWAFLSGEPQNASGGRPNYKGTPYQEALEADMFDNNFFALLRKTGARWKVVTYAIGCTDVCYLDWSGRYKAPKGIFPYSE